MPPGFEISEIAAFQDALVRNKQRQELYSRTPAPVNFIGPRLFGPRSASPPTCRPASIGSGGLRASDGQVTDAQRSNLVISKIGLEADIWNDFAQQRSALYGALAVALSLSLGWLAGVIFRRGEPWLTRTTE